MFSKIRCDRARKKEFGQSDRQIWSRRKDTNEEVCQRHLEYSMSSIGVLCWENKRLGCGTAKQTEVDHRTPQRKQKEQRQRRWLSERLSLAPNGAGRCSEDNNQNGDACRAYLCNDCGDVEEEELVGGPWGFMRSAGKSADGLGFWPLGVTGV